MTVMYSTGYRLSGLIANCEYKDEIAMVRVMG